jgi:hypothetical protein
VRVQHNIQYSIMSFSGRGDSSRPASGGGGGGGRSSGGRGRGGGGAGGSSKNESILELAKVSSFVDVNCRSP